MKAIKLKDDVLYFDDGTTIEAIHDQDCCENVYADFKQLEDTGFFGKEFDKINVVGINGSGIRINDYFVPCYNQQNGYYSSNLVLVLKNGKESKTIDISNFVKDEIE